MQNKNVIVIGGSSGIGLALCQKLENNTVHNISRTPCPVASVINHTADVTKPKELAKAFAEIDCADALFYCAGVSLAAPVAEIETSDCRKLFDTNLLGAVEAVKLAVPMLERSGAGRIVLCSSVGGTVPIAYDAVYSASKAALDMFARAVDLELKNTRCTSAVIGGVKTQFSFKRKIYEPSETYSSDLTTATDKLVKIEQSGYPATFVADELIKIADRTCAPVTAVGIKTKLMLWAYGILPQCVKQIVERAVFGLKK